ncbi:MAG TPA: ATP-binding protein [Solirubrobacteraceae bacterium]|jgi:K+-sensing histidine kinase KdpD|nr:ATP-binding protein [Solirubrobacteraceae bacterium]
MWRRRWALRGSGGTLAPLPGLAVAALAIALVTIALYPLRNVAPAASLGVVYLFAVLLVTTWSGLLLGLATAVVSAVAYNFFHLPPTGTLTIATTGNWVALLVFVAAAAAAAAVAELARRRAVEADQRRREADRAAEELRAAAAVQEALQRELVETAALRRSDELKTTILRSVSHDLRTPLTGIVAAGEALASPTLTDAERVELADVIAQDGRRMARLVDDLLDLSRLQADAVEPHDDWVSIEELLRAAAEAHPAGPGALRFAIDRDLPLVRADAVQLERAFANLLDNAVRHSGGRPVSVRARAVGQRLVVRIVDQGPGIPRTELERVFLPFHRSPGDEGPGVGLGLAIVRGFVELNGGTVRAESLPGQGTSMVVELPLERPPAAAGAGR